jgi:ribosome biogenesis GTPase
MTYHQGIVLRAHSSRYAVLDDAGVLNCRARRRLQREDPSWPEFPVAGDAVGWRLLSGAGAHREGVIETVYPRHSEITRSRFGSKHVVVANLDRLVVVVAIRAPDLDRGLLDRLLAAAERNGLGAILCINKIDLAAAKEIDALQSVYERGGYPVLRTSAETGTGIEALRDALRGHRSAFMGPSGAGKSRLIGRLQPGLKVTTGSVNDKSGQGRHTTTRVDLHRTDFGALLADTPGVRDFITWQLEPAELRDLFPEFRVLQEQCRFSQCTHVHEPECTVRAAVEAGAIDNGRYKSYSAILAELQDGAMLASNRGSRGRKEWNS